MSGDIEEEILCECSDDEMYNPDKLTKGTWQPKAEDMDKIFTEHQANKVLELSWKCPGRRPPDSQVKPEEEVKEDLMDTPPKQVEKKKSVPNEFDFDDDFPDTKAVLTPRRTPGSAPKSQKKVARMDKVLKDMMQQRKLQAAEREARKLTKSPRNSSPSRARIGSPAGSPRTPPTTNTNRQSPVRMGASGQGDFNMTTPLRAPIDSPMRAPIDSPLRAPLERESGVTTPTSEPGNPITDMGIDLSKQREATSVSSNSNSGRLTPSRQTLPISGIINNSSRPPSRESCHSNNSPRTQSPKTAEPFVNNSSQSNDKS